jgi:hypothetical protein
LLRLLVDHRHLHRVPLGVDLQHRVRRADALAQRPSQASTSRALPSGQ